MKSNWNADTGHEIPEPAQDKGRINTRGYGDEETQVGRDNQEQVCTRQGNAERKFETRVNGE